LERGWEMQVKANAGKGGGVSWWRIFRFQYKREVKNEIREN
jgi:hypothetical protein